MVKFLLMLFWRKFADRPQVLEEDDAWRNDPLAHPALQAMSARELADLPLGAGFVRAADQPPRR